MFASLDVLQAASQEGWAGIKHLVSEKCSGTEEERKRRCKDRQQHNADPSALGFFLQQNFLLKRSGDVLLNCCCLFALSQK